MPTVQRDNPKTSSGCASGRPRKHYAKNTAPHWLRRPAHSRERVTGPAATNRHTDSAMSITPPWTTLTRWHGAPLPDRSSAAPPSTLARRRHGGFYAVSLRRELRPRVDPYAQASLGTDLGGGKKEPRRYTQNFTVIPARQASVAPSGPARTGRRPACD